MNLKEKKFLSDEIEKNFIKNIPFDYEVALYVLINQSYNQDAKLKAEKDLLNVIEKLQKEMQNLLKLYKEKEEIINRAIEYLSIDEDIMNTCQIYDVNGIDLIKILKGEIIDD